MDSCEQTLARLFTPRPPSLTNQSGTFSHAHYAPKGTLDWPNVKIWSY